MKVSIGSKNPTKIKAVELAFQKMFPDTAIEFAGIEVTSGVSDQPMDDNETTLGAKNRASRALTETNADYGVGIEGGLQQLDDFWLTGNIAAIVDKTGTYGIGISTRIAIPQAIYDRIKDGKELSQVIEEAYGLKDIGKKEGLLGLMSKGLITRTSASSEAVIAALASLHKQ